jgi:hypothetical protein
MNFTPKNQSAVSAGSSAPNVAKTRSTADLERLKKERDALQQKISKCVEITFSFIFPPYELVSWSNIIQDGGFIASERGRAALLARYQTTYP